CSRPTPYRFRSSLHVRVASPRYGSASTIAVAGAGHLPDGILGGVPGCAGPGGRDRPSVVAARAGCDTVRDRTAGRARHCVRAAGPAGIHLAAGGPGRTGPRTVPHRTANAFDCLTTG